MRITWHASWNCEWLFSTMKHEVVLSMIDKKSGSSVSSKAFPSGAAKTDTLEYMSAASFAHQSTHWSQVTFTKDSEVHVVCGRKRPGPPFEILAVHEATYKWKGTYLVISYSIDSRYLAIIEIKQKREVRKPIRLMVHKPRRFARKAHRKLRGEGYAARFFRMLGFGRRSNDQPKLLRNLDQRTIARVRLSA